MRALAIRAMALIPCDGKKEVTNTSALYANMFEYRAPKTVESSQPLYMTGFGQTGIYG